MCKFYRPLLSHIRVDFHLLGGMGKMEKKNTADIIIRLQCDFGCTKF